ncbi:helix-turn-helix domain-containing protein [Microscilla marina]|uniref:Helix-turn-helix domain protein n=1 Tax=Microscilla marina ATCC 23134 TaxID=313606 RepID=A1ZQT9_MICM2|nr:helix-turn-helix transcriptional regulator [Microscilla marina]EAY27244.1 helix-turn-helix domain protein [Microscilla marina ATCC 23134]
MSISKRIKDIREQKGYTQKYMAGKLSIDQTNYGRFEKRGKKLTIEQLESIAAALGVSLKDILFGEAEQTNPDLSKLEIALLQCKTQNLYFVDNALKFILNIDTLLQKPLVKYAIGEILHPKQKDHQAFVRCYCELNNEVFTLATWQKPISQEASHFAHFEQNGEHLFSDHQRKEASQYKDAAFANIQQNHHQWTINFFNLTGFFRAAFGGVG